MARSARFNCDSFALCVRILTLVGHLCLMAAAGWGFILAKQRWDGYGVPTPGSADDVLNTLNSLSSNYAVFQGLESVYMILFGAAGVLSELRTQWLRRTVLVHATLLLSYFGRACLCFYTGARRRGASPLQGGGAQCAAGPWLWRTLQSRCRPSHPCVLCHRAPFGSVPTQAPSSWPSRGTTPDRTCPR
jgi:hypothetical protein